MNNYWVLDIETTVNGPEDAKASPFCPDNRAVLLGIKHPSQEGPLILSGLWDYTFDIAPPPELVIGHNIKFDLHYLRKTSRDDDKFRELFKDSVVWDTQIVEYILTGQQTKFASLNDLAIKYGFEEKVKGVKELWEVGVKTEDIDPELLKEYLIRDVELTEQIFLKQLEEVQRRDKTKLVLPMMDAVLAVADIEYNGMRVERKTLDTFGVRVLDEVDSTRGLIKTIVQSIVSTAAPKFPSDLMFNPDSPKDVSDFIHKGITRWESIETVKLKNGKTKIKKKEETVTTLLPPIPHTGSSVDEAALEEIIGLSTPPIAELARSILKYRGYKKEFSTYYEGIKKSLDLSKDERIHPSIHQCSTSTGRPSASKPNVMNFPRSGNSEFKKSFISRFEGGRLVEFDFKQIEMVVAAHLSQDKQLIKDLEDGVDIHNETAKKVYGRMPTDEERVACKIINFGGCLYGGGAKTISEQAGTTIEIARKCISTFYARYPEFYEWKLLVQADARAIGDYEGRRTKNGAPAKTFTLPSETGRDYTFHEYDAPDWVKARDGVLTSFSPTELSNYPIQGMATGDIVPTMLGELYRWLMKDKERFENIKIINYVYDSILLDVHPSVTDNTLKEIKDLLESAPKVINKLFPGLYFNLALKVDAKQGVNWGTLTKLSLDV